MTRSEHNDAVYFGDRKEFPNDMSLVPGSIYEIEIRSPEPRRPLYMVRVRSGSTDIYLPYQNASSIWEDWMPYLKTTFE